MKDLVGVELPGMRDKKLGNAMKALSQPDLDGDSLNQALEQVAKSRQRPVEEIRAEYEIFKSLREEAAKTPPPIESLHPIHQRYYPASPTQLRYGKVAGDALGVDPVFGSLLNPSGGLVGPANQAFDGGNSALGYHAVVHDAAGYLYRYHGVGNGYDYLKQEGRDTTSPLSGQRSGIRFWNQTLGAGTGGRAAALVMDGVVAGVDLSSKFKRNRTQSPEAARG